jgi:uncharacterized membrane protein
MSTDPSHIVSAYLLDWLSLLGRWVHLIAGIAWIGSSFYFVWLDNHLLRPADPELERKGVGGELWAVHGGGFYNAHKYRGAPSALPKSLHWFYWEAYSTFLSGFFLMCLLYYAQAEIYLIDPAVADLSRPQAVAIGLAFLVGGWLIYDGLCRTVLARHGLALSCVLAVLLTVAAWGMCRLFSGRGAYMEFGAMLGSIMVANVFFVIIPGQRKMVQAMREGREPDVTLGVKGKLRSTHNTYFTLPVLFTMISSHYAMTYGASYNWLVLMVLCIAGVCIRQYFVARHTAHERHGKTSPLPAVLGVLMLVGVAVALTPTPPSEAAVATGNPAAAFARVQAIIHLRCVNCHAAVPTQLGFNEAPKGIALESPDSIVTHATQIQQQIASRAMPVGNLTAMTEEERAEVLAWIQHGARH